MLLLAAALAPALFMMHFVYVRDRYEREPFGRIFIVFIVGCFAVIPAAMFESFFAGMEKWGLISIAISCWCVIALCEESLKYFVLRTFAVPHRSFNEIYDGILYSVAASLGFAAVENVFYVFLSEGQGLMVALMRAVLSVPSHALWGVMMGYFVGVAKFETDPRRKRALVQQGVITAIFWHGLYDFLAMGTDFVREDMKVLFVCGVGVVVIVNWAIASRLIRLAQAQSIFKRPSPLHNPIYALAPQYKFCHECGSKNMRVQSYCSSCGYRFPQ